MGEETKKGKQEGRIKKARVLLRLLKEKREKKEFFFFLLIQLLVLMALSRLAAPHHPPSLWSCFFSLLEFCFSFEIYNVFNSRPLEKIIGPDLNCWEGSSRSSSFSSIYLRSE